MECFRALSAADALEDCGCSTISTDDICDSEDMDSVESLLSVDCSCDTNIHWSAEQIMKMHRFSGIRHFLVKWEHLAEPMWSAEDDLLDWGFAMQVLAFLKGGQRVRPCAPRRRSCRRSCGTSQCCERKEAASDREPLLRSALERDTELRRLRLADPVALFPRMIEELVETFAHRGQKVLLVENVCVQERADAFMRLSKALATKPQQVFHGTSSLSLAGIIRDGLVMPGRGGVQVVNGSAYGRGIYTATYPQVNYASHFDHLAEAGVFQMLCCAGLLTPSVRRAGTFAVFFDAALVLPCFLVTLRPAASVHPHALPRYSRSLVSELPVKVPCPNNNLVAYPQAGVVVGIGEPAPSSVPHGLRIMARGSLSLQSRRVVCLARGDHLIGEQGPTWYDRRRRNLTKLELRRLPRSAKSLFPLLPERRQDQTRSLERRRRHLDRRHARAQKANSFGPGDA